MTPEEKAREKIDQMFNDAGWKVVDRDFYSPAIIAAAIREGLLMGNREADYFLFVFAGLPSLDLKKKALRDCQYEAITELENSFRSGQDRALIVLATGARIIKKN